VSELKGEIGEASDQLRMEELKVQSEEEMVAA